MTVDTLDLSGKVAIVTGSGRENGIGAAIARALARNGASVAIHYVSESTKPRAEKLAANIRKEFGAQVAVIQGPIEKLETAQDIVSKTLQAFNATSIDILVNNAGIAGPEDLLSATPEMLEAYFGVNVFGPLYMIQAVVGAGKMPRGGRIINIGSIASKMGLQVASIYAAAKAAQDSMTASWAGELGHSRGITVNTVAPGHVPTDITARANEKAPGGDLETLQTALLASTRAAPRHGTVEDIVDAVLLLASEKSRWISAQWVSVSGGVTGTM
ncbi:hypothetical protein PG995_014820 [Apiospora arundinis]